MNDANRAFFAEHYGPSTGWTVEELHLTVLVPTSEPGGSLELVREILADAAFDIRVEVEA